MPTTINGEDVRAVLRRARALGSQGNLTPSPLDWRDCWIYFLVVDRFNKPAEIGNRTPADVHAIAPGARDLQSAQGSR